MGIDIEGGMIVGRFGGKLKVPETFDGDIHDFAEKNEMDCYSTFYDCDIEYCIFGFEIDEIEVGNIDKWWLDNVKEKAKRFKAVFGVDAKLFGSQNVW